MLKSAKFRFYEELNDFLPENKRKKDFIYEFSGKPSIKDAIEALGVPHTEVDLILINHNSVTFSAHLQEGDQVSVYPVFESLNIKNITRLREKPLRRICFILDINLGKLARYLRMFGLDALYNNSFSDNDIIKLAIQEKRIILTRDTGLLKNKKVTHGYWIRSQNPREQIREVIKYFHLESNIIPFSRCIVCNGVIKLIRREYISSKIPFNTGKYYNKFYQCVKCKKVYWHGSHYNRMKKFVEETVYKPIQ